MTKKFVQAYEALASHEGNCNHCHRNPEALCAEGRKLMKKVSDEAALASVVF